MKHSTSKVLAQFIAGIFGGTILGILGFVNLINYGGNHGCWAYVDALFGTAGYESCGAFGAISGVIIGSILGITAVSMVKISNYKKAAAWLAVGSFLLPFLYGAIMFWPPFGDDDLLIVPPVVVGFIIASAIPSVIMTASVNWEKFLRRKNI